jgi:hypothetical protein
MCAGALAAETRAGGRYRHGQETDAFDDAGDQQLVFGSAGQAHEPADRAGCQAEQAEAQRAQPIGHDPDRRTGNHGEGAEGGRQPAGGCQRQTELAAQQRQRDRQLSDVHRHHHSAGGGGQDGEPGGLGPPRFGHQLQTSVVPN